MKKLATQLLVLLTAVAILLPIAQACPVVSPLTTSVTS